ncbi:hypothetical protein [Paludibaculum fermentans]|uniref:hypothetical protein n=1 Tax=Paludibaculum fermentans TaxID=1473598 RepID=UPI003EC054E5
MSYDPEEARMEAAREEYEAEIGAQYLREFGYELYPEHYAEAITEFTSERLQSYYVANPNLGLPAIEAMMEARELRTSHPRPSLVLATTALELAVKVVLLKPIVFGLVHIEGLAGFITELAIKHTGMERFRDLLAAILAQFGGVDLKTYTRPDSTRTLWVEMEHVQSKRNGAIHRGDEVQPCDAVLSIDIASTLLNVIFPQVLLRLGLHLHEPGIICGKLHGVSVSAYFTIPSRAQSAMGRVILDLEALDLDNMPPTISGRLGPEFPEEDRLSLRSLQPVPMWITSTLVHYEVSFLPDSDQFTGTRSTSFE